MKYFLVIIFLLMSNLLVAQDSVQNDFFLAETYFRQGEYKKATQIYKKLYNKSEFNNTFLNRLISCYQQTDDFKTVESLLQKRIKKNASHTYLFVFLGYNYQRQQQQELANTNYQKAINSLNKNTTYGGLIGRLFKEYNLLDNAIFAYEKAMQGNPNANYNFQIAQIYGEKGAFKKMFESYIDMVDKNQNYLNYHKNLVLYY